MDEQDIRINRVKLAFAIAVLADLMEFPVLWLESFGWDSVVLFGRAIGVLLDACVMFILSKLLGFHWALVPSFVLEVIPTVDMFPSWVACVAYVVWERKKKQQAQLQPSTMRPLIDVQEVKAIGASIVSRLASPPPTLAPAQIPPPLLPAEPAHEKRLQSLADLRDKNLISPTEYEAKRQQILAEI